MGNEMDSGSELGIEIGNEMGNDRGETCPQCPIVRCSFFAAKYG
jgi:hypothetical protein